MDFETPEHDLLCLCVSADAERQIGRIEDALSSETDWAILIGTALRHGVGSLLLRTLERVENDRVPSEILRGLQRYHLLNQGRADRLLQALFEVVDHLQLSGITALPLKGSALAAVAYGDIGLRIARDIDLLVRECDIDATCNRLRELGFKDGSEIELGRPLTAAEDHHYRRYQCEYQFFREKDGVTVEPHWAVAPWTMAVDFDHRSAWSRAEELSLAGRSVPALSLIDHLLLVCVHGGKHKWQELRWICDVERLAARLNDEAADSVLQLAKQQRIERFLLTGLGIAESILGAELPKRISEKISSDKACRSLIRSAAQTLFQPDAEEHTPFRVNQYLFNMREHWGDRARYVLRTVTTPTFKHIRMVSLPAPVGFLYTPIRLLHDYIALPVWKFGRVIVGEIRWLLRKLSAEERVLLIESVPDQLEGAGFPRTLAILRALDDAGIKTTLHPPDPFDPSKNPPSSGIPRSVEIIAGRGIDTLNDFLRKRRREYSAVIVSRPPNMARFVGMLVNHPNLTKGLRLIYDSEALFAARDIRKTYLAGEPLDQTSQNEMLAQEVSLATVADDVLAVSRNEQDMFRRFGARNVHLLGYAIRPALTPRPFEDRTGLLFVGRVAEDGWPNADSLVWFRDQVWPIVRQRLGDIGHTVTVTVAGKLGARSMMEATVDGIHLLGPVNLLYPLYDAARLFIAPTRYAAGIPLKVLDAAAHGVPVVATTLLADQLGWRHGKELLASDVSDAAAFAENIVSAYTQPAVWQELRRHAAQRIQDESSPERFRDTLASVVRAQELA